MSALGLDEQLLLTGTLDNLTAGILHGAPSSRQPTVLAVAHIASQGESEFELCVTYFLGRIGRDLRALAMMLGKVSGRSASEVLDYAGGLSTSFPTIGHLIAVAVASAESDMDAVGKVVREFVDERDGAERAVFLAEVIGVCSSVHGRVCGVRHD